MPALGWLRAYHRSWLAKDLVGGLSAGAVVVPQAMAYATIADLPVEVGLYTCMLPMIVYAVLGGSRTLSVSTTSTVATLTASTLLAAGVAASGTDPVGDLAMLTLLVGVILLVGAGVPARLADRQHLPGDRHGHQGRCRVDGRRGSAPQTARHHRRPDGERLLRGRPAA